MSEKKIKLKSPEKKEKLSLKKSPGDQPSQKASSSEEDKKEELRKQLDQALSDNLYLRADFENFKKRTYEEKKQLLLYGGETLISALANEVLDDLDRAVFSAKEKESFENLKKGLDIIQKKLSQVLKNFGVEIIDPTGQEFDPSYQEAISHIRSSKVPEGCVAETFKKAYKLHDKVIRPAQVVLAKSKPED